MSRNPFECLGESEPEEIIVVAPIVKKGQVVKPLKKKEIKEIKEIKAKSNTLMVNSTPFEEEPKHKKEKDEVKTKRKLTTRGTTREKGGEKKDVAGKGTWGDELTGQMQQSDQKDEENKDDELEEPEIEYKSLTQFNEEKEQLKTTQSLQSKVRKPNEGIDASLMKSQTPLKKNEENDVFFVGKKVFLIKKSLAKLRNVRSRKGNQKQLLKLNNVLHPCNVKIVEQIQIDLEVGVAEPVVVIVDAEVIVDVENLLVIIVVVEAKVPTMNQIVRLMSRTRICFPVWLKFLGIYLDVDLNLQLNKIKSIKFIYLVDRLLTLSMFLR